MLECFAYWKQLPASSDGFRWGTLIVGNGDERIVGNCVLKNPGSAEPVYGGLFTMREDGRECFSLDPTMHAVAELFDLEGTGGTVRLWNLADIRDVNPDNAFREITADSFMEEDIAGQILSGPRVPTYLGWGNLWRHSLLQGKAKAIFDAALPDSPYLAPTMETNAFFHPLYLLRYGNHVKACWEVRRRFKECLQQSVL